MCKAEEKVQAISFEVPEMEIIPRRLSLSVDNQGFNFESEGYSENFLLTLVDRLRGENVQATIVPKVSEEAVQQAVKTSTIVSNDVPTNIPVYIDPNSKTTLGDKLGDLSKQLYATAGVEHQEDDTSFYHTGIKVKNNKNHYRCGYTCPKCGEYGRHYIPSHAKVVNCHKCNTPLVVEHATPNGFGEGEKYRDDNGNYFIAEMIDYATRK